MRSPEEQRGALAHNSYVAVALQPRTYGCRNKQDVKRNLENVCRLIDEAMYTSRIVGNPLKLVTLTEGSLQGMWDEYSDMDQATYCRDIAIIIPGEETERLAAKAKQYGVYLAAQAKVLEPEIMPDRFFNVGFLISPEGKIILKHTKNIISVIEGTASPYDVWEKWSAKMGEDLEAYYPVAKTEIGNIAIAICAETIFPETFRAFALMGAEVVIKMAMAEPLIMSGYWEFINRARAFDNVCYIIAPNFGPYFTHPGAEAPYSLAGGHSMIVDYRGNVVAAVEHGNEAFVPGEIRIRDLREYRASAGLGTMLAQMRSGLWKQIYERWPDYPKNRYLEKTVDRAMDRAALQIQAARRLFEAGIYTPPI